MGWIWQEGKTGEKGAGKGGKNGNAGKTSAKGNAGKTSATGNAGKTSAKVYVYCKTPDCNGRVFMGPQPIPEKCKVCHHCDVPFAFPRFGKGGNNQGLKKPAANTSSTPTAAITTAYDQLIENGMSAEQAHGVLHGLGHVLPKPTTPKQPTDAYAKISKLNGEISTMQNIIEQKIDKHLRLSGELSTLFEDIEERKIAVAELIATRSIQMAELPTTTLFPTVNVKPPEVATYLRSVEADWERLIEIGNSFVPPEGQAPFNQQFCLLRDRTLQACKLQHEHIAFPTDSLAADAAELVDGSEADAEVGGEEVEFPFEYLDATTAASSHFPALASRQEENKRQGLALARTKKKARASS